MTKLGRRAARPLATGVIAPPTTATRCIIIPMKLKSSSLAGVAWQTAVGENSRFEQDQPDVNIETTPDEHRVLQDAHKALITLRRNFDNWVGVGRGLQLLRRKADQIGTRNAFNDLRDQHHLGDKHLRKEAVSRLLKVMDNLQAVLARHADGKTARRLGFTGHHCQALPDLQQAQNGEGRSEAVALRQACASQYRATD
jgi:hypothetical protein